MRKKSFFKKDRVSLSYGKTLSNLRSVYLETKERGRQKCIWRKTGRNFSKFNENKTHTSRQLIEPQVQEILRKPQYYTQVKERTWDIQISH